MFGPVASEIGRTIGNFGGEKARSLGVLLAVFELGANILPDHLGRIVFGIGAEEYFFPLVEDIDDDILVEFFLAGNVIVQLRLGETGAVRNALRGCPRKAFLGKLVDRGGPYCAENAPPAAEDLVPSGQFGVFILVAVTHPYLPRLVRGLLAQLFLDVEPYALVNEGVGRNLAHVEFVTADNSCLAGKFVKRLDAIHRNSADSFSSVSPLSMSWRFLIRSSSASSVSLLMSGLSFRINS